MSSLSTRNYTREEMQMFNDQTGRINDLSKALQNESGSNLGKVEQVRKQYEQFMTERGIYMLGGLIDIRKLPRKIQITDEEYWTIEKVNEDQEYEVPETVLTKYENLKEAGVPELCLVWVEQYFEPKAQKPEERKREPVGVTVGAVVADLLLSIVTAPVRAVLDPLLVMVLPVTDFEGVGVVLGCWKH